MALKHFSLAGFVLSGLLAIAGHFPAGELSPWRHTISDFAAADRGGGVEWAMALAVLSTLALLPALRRFGHLTRACLLIWCAGLTVATIIPTDPVGQALGTLGYIHRYASAVAFIGLLTAGFRLWRATLSNVVGCLNFTGTAGGIAMLASTYVLNRYAIGVTERIMALAELTMLIVVAARLILTGEPTVHSARRSASALAAQGSIA